MSVLEEGLKDPGGGGGGVEMYPDTCVSSRPLMKDAVEQSGSQHSDPIAVEQLSMTTLARHKVHQPICISIHAGTPARHPAASLTCSTLANLHHANAWQHHLHSHVHCSRTN